MLALDIRREYKSSMIRRIEYEENRGVLSVLFVGGAVYDYYKVPLEVFQEFETIVNNAKANIAFDSIGHHFNERVKPFYKYKRVMG